MSLPNIGTGQKKVTSAGTAVKLIATNTPCKKVIVSALPGNVGAVVVGGSAVSAVSGSENGVVFAKAATQQNFPVEIDIEDVSKLYVDAVNNNDGVAFVYLY